MNCGRAKVYKSINKYRVDRCMCLFVHACTVGSVPVDCSAVGSGLSVGVGTLGVEPRVMFLTTVAKGTASVTGGRQLTLLMLSTHENASGHGLDRQSS